MNFSDLKHKGLYWEPDQAVRTWNELCCIYYDKFSNDSPQSLRPEWIFRGDHPNPGPNKQDVEGVFASKIEKEFTNFGIMDPEVRRRIERRMIRSFRRKAHLHTSQPQGSWLDVLALMQHHGSPTRMLDWTYSFFAAVYFAINRIDNADDKSGSGSCIVWELNSTWLGKVNRDYEDEYIRNVESESGEKEARKLEELRRDARGGFESQVLHDLINAEEQQPVVYAVNPYFLHERLSSQRGVLLCQGDIGRSWGANLEHLLAQDNDSGKALRLWRIPIVWEKHEGRNQFLRRLREVNIDQASLFPGLDGFADSLRTLVAYPPQAWLVKDPNHVDTSKRVRSLGRGRT